MIYINNAVRWVLVTVSLSAAGCAVTKPQVDNELASGLEVAAALESAYAAQPSANAKVVADMARLLASAQAAVVSFSNSTSPTSQAAASAAIAALVDYEASAQLAP